MEKFIPYEKLSKKEKRKLDQAKRQTWGELNPVTRTPKNSRAYDRKKAQNWKRELSGSALLSADGSKPMRSLKKGETPKSLSPVG